MTTDKSEIERGPTRRDILRRGAVLGGVTVAGVAVASGSAWATECPRTPGYWANHAWPDTIDDPFTVGDVTRPISEWKSFLVSSTKGDKADILAQHLIATILNFQHQAAEDSACVDVAIEEYGGRTMREIKADAQGWLQASAFDTDAKQTTWMVDGTDGEPLKNALDDFNNHRLGLDCGC